MFVFATNYSYLKEYQNQPKSESAGTTKKKKKKNQPRKMQLVHLSGQTGLCAEKKLEYIHNVEGKKGSDEI